LGWYEVLKRTIFHISFSIFHLPSKRIV
jgi:hypothetical protein